MLGELAVVPPIRVRRPFFFDGAVPRSKSWLNRALILQSLFDQIEIDGWDSSASAGDDVRNLWAALNQLRTSADTVANGATPFFIGDSGTGLRFLLARLSREVGDFTVEGSERLFSRPHAELLQVLTQVGTEILDRSLTSVTIRSRGWPVPADGKPLEIVIDATDSSQFASAFLLSGAKSTERLALTIRSAGGLRSRGYVEMSVQLLRQVGIDVSESCDGRGELRIEIAPSEVKRTVLQAEPDWSAVFALASLAAVETGGELILSEADTANFTETVQPDAIGIRYLQLCGVDVEWNRRLIVRGQSHRRGIDCDLSGAPDLFPCLAAVLATAEGTSRLYGAPHLRLKESDRIRSTANVLKTLGLGFSERADGIELHGKPGGEIPAWWRERSRLRAGVLCDPDRDHRIAFQVAVFAQSGAPVQSASRGVVAKSYPQFWSIVEGDAPRFALIGHRGSGKSRALALWSRALGAEAFDLDERIGGSAALARLGESEFRALEREGFSAIDRETRSAIAPVLVAVGGGFDPALLLEGWRALWVRRPTDCGDRVFLDRPRLNPSLSARDEWRLRRESREPRLRNRADRVFELPEGISDTDEIEALWLRDLCGLDSIAQLGGVISVTEDRNLAIDIARWLRWGVDRIEVRDDIVTSAAAWAVTESIPSSKLLLSLRSPQLFENTLNRFRARQRDATKDYSSRVPPDRLSGDVLLDVPLRFFERCRFERSDLKKVIVSVHDEDLKHFQGTDPFRLVAERLGNREQFFSAIKIAVTVSSFSELEAWHRWSRASDGFCARRVFLPMTAELPARWGWYRLYFSARFPALAFFREGVGTSADQPTLYDWMAFRNLTRANSYSAERFAAVLGAPVNHSRTPQEQREFFRRHKLPVFSIAMSAEECAVGLPFLESIGLVAAAVTSPLKNRIGAMIDSGVGRPVNTVCRSKTGEWTATSTDQDGFQALLEEAGVSASEPVVIWGGGGVLPALESVLNQGSSNRSVTFVRAREGAQKALSGRVLVWAAGAERSMWTGAFCPELVIDLSYGDDSAGREIALECKARYVSGLTMFKVQAESQRKFWEAHL